MNKIKRVGSQISMKYGLLFFGLISFFAILVLVALVFLVDLLGMISVLMLGGAYIGFILLIIIPFVIALKLFGRKLAKDISSGRSLMSSSVRFSFGVNIFIWTLALLSSFFFIESKDFLKALGLYVLLIFILGLLTTVSIGLVISKEVKSNLEILDIKQ